MKIIGTSRAAMLFGMADSAKPITGEARRARATVGSALALLSRRNCES